MLTLHILTRNNATTLTKCLESVSEIGCRIVVGDMGSEDGTREICRDFDAEIVEVEFEGDFSAIRNRLCGGGRNMYLEPWERVVRGSDSIESLNGGHSFYVIEDGVVSKQVRLWDRGKFENPVFETVVGSGASVNPGVVVVSEGRPDDRERNREICELWVERRPTSPDPHYYLACSLLAEGRIKEFVSEAVRYLSMEPYGGDSSLLMNYYLSRVNHSLGEYRDAYRRALGCLVGHPSFAEFWCLIGDMLFRRGDHPRAAHMYNNAVFAGRRRPSDDTFPVELAKYGAYPEAMAEKCSAVISEGIMVGRTRTEHR